MAVTTAAANEFKYQLLKAVESHTLKAILMNTTFAFDKDSHTKLSDITSNQLATGNGYTQDNKALANVAVTKNNTDDKAVLTADDITWTASGGSIGAFGAVVFYDDTMTDDVLIGCIDFGTDYTVTDGFSFTVGVEFEVGETA